MTVLDRIRDNRQDQARLKAELPQLVDAAFAAGHSWQEIAEALGGVSKGRVSQIRKGY